MVVWFHAPTRIAFGLGSLSCVPSSAREMGHHALVVTGRDTHRVAELIEGLSGEGVTTTLFSVPSEPTVELITSGVDTARRAGCDVVIGFGGGSAIDAGKAIAALCTNREPVKRYLEVVGEGRPIVKEPLSFIAVPTTAGTGAEVTRNAVIKVVNHRVKVSIRSPLMLPTLAVIDPETTVSMSRQTTAATGLDALTQVLEPFVSTNPSPITDALCRDGLRLAARFLERAFDNPHDIEARDGMCRVSLFGGLALANAKLGAVHGFAGPIGGMFDAPHGVICGRLLPPVIAANIEAIKAQGSRQEMIARFDEVARILTGDPTAVAEDAIRWVADLGRTLSLPPLRKFGISSSRIEEIVQKAKNASSMKGNPIELTESELAAILEQVL